eukprot:UN08856
MAICFLKKYLILFRNRVICTPINRCIYTSYSNENFQDIIFT